MPALTPPTARSARRSLNPIDPAPVARRVLTVTCPRCDAADVPVTRSHTTSAGVAWWWVDCAACDDFRVAVTP